MLGMHPRHDRPDRDMVGSCSLWSHRITYSKAFSHLFLFKGLNNQVQCLSLEYQTGTVVNCKTIVEKAKKFEKEYIYPSFPMMAEEQNHLEGLTFLES